MATTNLNIRIDDELKKEAEDLFRYLGLTMSSAITMFLRSAVNNDGIPFELKRHEPNAETIAAMEDAKNDRNLHGPFDSIDALLEDLNA